MFQPTKRSVRRYLTSVKHRLTVWRKKLCSHFKDGKIKQLNTIKRAHTREGGRRWLIVAVLVLEEAFPVNAKQFRCHLVRRQVWKPGQSRFFQLARIEFQLLNLCRFHARSVKTEPILVKQRLTLFYTRQTELVLSIA